MLFQYEKIGYKQLKDMVTSAAMVIGCAEVVCDKLKTLGGKKIGLQYEFIDTDKVVYSKDKRAELKEKIGIPKDKFVWAMSGIINYRKGADMVPAIAEQLRKEACIIWLGGNNSGLKYYIEKDIEARKLDNVFFLGAKVDDYYEYLSLADGFLLTSREDPFPLVMIEGAALGKPIVSFNSGGVKEFVKEGMGIVVDSWDSNDLVKAMQQIQQREYNYDERILIEAARDFGVKVQIDKWIDLMARNFQV
jgi:glycosyltransferase involved in cell wall biosynthesis